MVFSEEVFSGICRIAIDHYGRDNQTLKTMEELCELVRALARYAIEPTAENFDNVSEEIADCEIMIEQLKIMHMNRKAVNTWKTYKLKRLSEKIIKA